MIRLICYDIADNKARTKLANLLEYQGFERIQYSVFVGKVPPARWGKCWEQTVLFFEQNCAQTDRVYSHIIDQDNFKEMLILGEPLDKTWILNEQHVIFI